MVWKAFSVCFSQRFLFEPHGNSTQLYLILASWEKLIAFNFLSASLFVKKCCLALEKKLLPLQHPWHYLQARSASCFQTTRHQPWAASSVNLKEVDWCCNTPTECKPYKAELFKMDFTHEISATELVKVAQNLNMKPQNLVSGSNNNHSNISSKTWHGVAFFPSENIFMLHHITSINHPKPPQIWSLKFVFVFHLQSAINPVVIGLDRQCVSNSSSLVNVVGQKFRSPDVTAVCVFPSRSSCSPVSGVFREVRGTRAAEQLNPWPSPITIKAVICDYTAHSAEQRWKLPWKGGRRRKSDKSKETAMKARSEMG